MRLTLPDDGIGAVASPFRVTAFDRVDSTSTVARAMAEAGTAHGTVVWAREQSAGRGRLSRQWSSPPGNLYLSVVLRPAVAAARVAEMGFACALAVAETAEAFLPHGPAARLKWPNDVLLDGAKIAGILLEGQFSAQSLAYVVAGIGINVASSPDSPTYQTISLRALGSGEIEPGEVLKVLLTRLSVWLETWTEVGFAPVRAVWMDRAARLGKTITVRIGNEPVEGLFDGIDDTGALLLRTAGGIRRITAGEVAFGQAATDTSAT